MRENLEIRHGYQTAVLGRVITMHAEFYGQHYGFGQEFETKVGSEMVEFLSRVSRPMNEIWTVQKEGKIVGSIAIDGEDLGGGAAHLRWFVMDEGARGSGAGRKLLETALQFSDECGFEELHLWTFHSLDAARLLYEQSGFKLVHEETGSQWGSKVLEQKFVRTIPH